MEKIGADMASDHTMGATMLFHIHYSSLRVSLDGIWISQREVLLWRMSTRLVPCVRLVVIPRKKKQVYFSLYYHVYGTTLS
jgi:hypothetical protein